MTADSSSLTSGSQDHERTAIETGSPRGARKRSPRQTRVPYQKGNGMTTVREAPWIGPAAAQ
jgi:hypothetical protein